jgi:hypothetical protein
LAQIQAKRGGQPKQREMTLFGVEMQGGHRG